MGTGSGIRSLQIYLLIEVRRDSKMKSNSESHNLSLNLVLELELQIELNGLRMKSGVVE